VTSASLSVAGFLAPGYEEVGTELARFVADDPTYSAQFCAYVAGELVVDIWGGPDADRDSIQGVFSSTKGASAICIALLLERGLLDLDAPMSRYWPEFAQGGKDAVTVRLALSHRAGLVGVEPQVTIDQLIDHELMAERVAAQVPHWRPGAAHGYHALTIGTLMDELVRRIDGRPIAVFFREEIGDPRDIDFFIATPEREEPRVRDVLPAQPGAAQSQDVQPPLPVDSLTGMAMNAAAAALFDPLMTNVPAVRAAGLAAGGGTGSARGLARLYATCTSEVDGMPRLMSPETVALVTQIHSVGHDLVLGIPTRFGIVFQKADERLWYGSHQAFGHDGAGGAMGVADPWHDLAYGYVPRRMSLQDGGLALARTLRQCRLALRP
jgi:CubicO group peptidase (beta-lactamase class C family)